MDMQALFKVQCSLVLVSVEQEGKKNACIANTLLQQSHVPVKFSLTLDKSHLTHDLVNAKGSAAVSLLSTGVGMDTIKRFGFSSGRDVDKFDGIDSMPDCNGNPMPGGEEYAARFSLKVYQTVDVGTHTLFLCTADSMENLEYGPITYSQYMTQVKNKMK